MTYNGVITTEAEIALMAGQLVGAGATEANNNFLVAQAEAYLSGVVQDDVKAGFAAYDEVTKQMLSEWAARYAGMTLILNDPSTYTDLIEAEDMVQVHIYRMEKIELDLREGEIQKQLKVNP